LVLSGWIESTNPERNLVMNLCTWKYYQVDGRLVMVLSIFVLSAIITNSSELNPKNIIAPGYNRGHISAVQNNMLKCKAKQLVHMTVIRHIQCTHFTKGILKVTASFLAISWGSQVLWKYVFQFYKMMAMVQTIFCF
jgi:hypothetical protein